MATNQDNSSNIYVDFISNDLASYILTNLTKIDAMFFENRCTAKFFKARDNKLRLSFGSQQDFSKAFEILNEHLSCNTQFPPVSVPPQPQSAEIELDEGTHHYTISHLEEINRSLLQQFGSQVRIEEGSEGNNIKILAPDNNVIKNAFSYLKQVLEKIHQKNLDNQTDESSIRPVVSDDKVDIKWKQCFIPEALYDLIELEIDNIFKQNGVDYTKLVSSSNTLILEYEGSRPVVDRLSAQLDAILKEFQELNLNRNKPACTAGSPSDQAEPHYVYQDDGQNPLSPDVISQSNPFYNEMHQHTSDVLAKPTDNQQGESDIWQDEASDRNSMEEAPAAPSRRPGSSSSAENTATNDISNQNSSNQTPYQFPHTEHQDPILSTNPVPSKHRREKRDNVLSKAMKGDQNASPQTPVSPVSSESHDTSGNTLTPELKEVPTVPNSTTPFNATVSALSQDTTSQSHIRKREDEPDEPLKKTQMSSTPPCVRTSSFNHPQIVDAISPLSHDTPIPAHPTPSEKNYPSDIPHTSHEEVPFSHQTLDTIIRFHDNYACVVTLPEGTDYRDANRIEQQLLNLKVVHCSSQEHVITLIADEKKTVKDALQELSKKLGRLGYLPPCNGMPIMTEAVKCIVGVSETQSPSKTCRVLASLTCTSGIKITLKHMKFDDGKWGAVLKSADSNSINSKRLENLKIIDVVGDNIDQKECRNLANTSEKLEKWQFFVTYNQMPFSKFIIYLVLPGWNPINFKGSYFKQSIKSVLDYCTKKGISSIAFPVIGHESKRIPIPLSAQALLQGIDDFSANISNSSKLQNIDIIISRDTQIRSFLYHFVTPIQNQIKQSKYRKKIAASESVDEEEETCSICLDPLYSDVPVRQLTKCKHEFHEMCIVRAIEIKPICPLCTTPLGVQRGNQPPGGKMSHSVTFTPLAGYPQDGTITIQYRIPGGVQEESHPNPGVPHSGTSRTAYLPDNEKGRKVLSLLQVGFDRGLIFTVGTSRTSGIDNVVTWNDIHHKTAVSGTHGYPDMEYLGRVLAELKDKGVQ